MIKNFQKSIIVIVTAIENFFCLFSIAITLLFTKIDENKMCVNNINFPTFANRYRLHAHLTSQTEHQSRLGIVRVSFRDMVNYIHYLNLAPTLIITSTNSKPKNSPT